ncbi:MAG: universal stress protein [Planctomycetales bacterium]|nr:universal stress protein [Planctomycetales bacterium]
MNRFKKILVATDTRLDHHPIVEEAAELARRNKASLKIVDVVPEFPWTVRMSMQDHEHVRQLMIDEKQEKLGMLADTLSDEGLKVQWQVLAGKTSVEIIREVLREGHDLVMRVARGADSRSPGFFGQTGFRLLRKCPCAVWLVTPETTPKFRHVLGCVDSSSGAEIDTELNDKVFELSDTISQYHGGTFSIIHTWSIWNEHMLRRRMHEDDYDELERRNQVQVENLLNAFLKRHGATKDHAHVHLLKGEPHILIPKFIEHNAVDLVVMGTVARCGMAGMLMGNTAERILNHISCSVLALKPACFRTPVQLEG